MADNMIGTGAQVKKDTPLACKNFRLGKKQIRVVKGSRYCVDYGGGISWVETNSLQEGKCQEEYYKEVTLELNYEK